MRRSSPLVFVFVAVFVDMVGYGIVVPLLPFYAGGPATGAALIGALASLYAAMQFFGGPFLGGLSDRVGRRPVLVLCLFGASLAYLLLGVSETFGMVVLAVVLAGAAGGTQATAQAYIADSTAPEERARGLGLVGAAFGLGLMAGPLLGGLLSLLSLQAPARAEAARAGALAGLNALFGLLFLPESLPPSRRTRTPLLRLNPVSGLAGVLRLRGAPWLLVAVFLLNISFAGLLTNFPLFSGVRFGWGATENAFFFAFVGVCAVLTQGLLVGRLQRRLGEPWLALGGLFLTALCLALVGVSASGWALYPIVGVLAFGAGLAIPGLTALLSRRAPADGQGGLMGGVQAVLSLALISGPVLAGAAFDNLGAPAPYLVGGALAALAVPATATALRAARPHKTPGPGAAAQEPASVPEREIRQARERSPL